MAYAQFATGYKGGGINPRPFTVNQVLPFEPETVDAYEVDLKTDLLNQRLRFNVSAFLNKYKDIILIDTNGYPGPPCGPDDPFTFDCFSAAPFNAGDADIKGVELETTFFPVNGLKIQGQVSYLDFEYQTLSSDAGGIELGFVPPFTPEWKWSLFVSYDIMLPGGSTITPQIDANYMDDIFSDPDNSQTNHISSHTVANARISYLTAYGDWEVILGVTNLTDKHYYTTAFDVWPTSGTSRFMVARPREWYVTLRRNF
jgi:iron complex outermembrane receptor protein